MKANAEPRLLSSLVYIDSGVEVPQHRLESFFFQEIKCNGMTSFVEFMYSYRNGKIFVWEYIYIHHTKALAPEVLYLWEDVLYFVIPCTL